MDEGMKHTPGPWWTDAKYNVEEMGCAVIAARTDCGPLPGNPTRGMVAFATTILKENAVRCEADARLIAAAPDLLALLQRWSALDGGSWHVERHAREKAELLADTRAAIAKATGGAHD